jgi:hypothetical protein
MKFDDNAHFETFFRDLGHVRRVRQVSSTSGTFVRLVLLGVSAHLGQWHVSHAMRILSPARVQLNVPLVHRRLPLHL